MKRLLLLKLFPQLNHVFGRGHFYVDGWRERYKDKRISSGSYIDRYFSYTVPKGEISDVAFQQLIEDIISKDFLGKENDLEDLMRDVDVGNFLFKLLRLEHSFDEHKMARLAQNLCLLGAMFPSNVEGMFRIGDHYWFLAKFISNCIVSQPDDIATLDLIGTVFVRAMPIDFGFEIRHSLYAKVKNDPYNLKVGEIALDSVSQKLYKRARSEKSLIQLYEDLEEASFRDLLLIGSQQHKNVIMSEVRQLIENDAEMFMCVLYAFCSTIRSTSHPKPYKAGFNQSWYELLRTVVSVDYFYKKSNALYGKQSDTGLNNEREPMTNEQLVGAFQKIYRENKSNKKGA